jgi:hypothetical protein
MKQNAKKILSSSTLFLPPFRFQHRMTSFFQVRKQIISAKGERLRLPFQIQAMVTTEN